MADILRADRRGVGRAAEVLRRGGLVAFPTETVYGLGGDARRSDSVAAIFAAKDRPRFNPLIIHVRDRAHAGQFGVLNEAARRLAERFWPGALTLVVPRAKDCAITPLACAGGETIALRVPSHEVARRLLALIDIPIAAPSVNLSGMLSATNAGDISPALAQKIDLILDGGASPLGLESTIIGCFDDGLFLLREGALSREKIVMVSKAPLKMVQEVDGQPLSPGRLAAHYAPRAALRLNAHEIRSGEQLLAFGETKLAHEFNLSADGDLEEAARNFFAMLHALDARCDRIAVMPIPETGLGRAINDRLRRASASG